MTKLIVEVLSVLSAGLILMFGVIVLTVAVFPAARDNLIRELTQPIHQEAQK